MQVRFVTLSYNGKNEECDVTRTEWSGTGVVILSIDPLISHAPPQTNYVYYRGSMKRVALDQQMAISSFTKYQ